MSLSFKNQVSEEFLRNIPLPKQTESYTVIPNSLIFDVLGEKLNEYGMKIKQEICTSSSAGNRCIVNYDCISDDTEMGIRIAFKNSYDRTMSFGLALGSVVWVCSNGMVVGEEHIKRVHTGNAERDVEEFCRIGMDNYQLRHNENIKLREKLKNIEIKKEECSEIIGKLLVDNVMNGREVTAMRNQLFKSDTFATLEENASGIITAWDLYNHGTEALKMANFQSAFDKYGNYTNVYKEAFGL